MDAALGRAAAGDTDSFEQVVRSFWEPVMRFYWRRVGRAEAEDLTQQLFVSVLRAIRSGGGPRCGDAVEWRRFLMASARNGLVSHWRRQRVRPPARSLARLLGDERGDASRSSSPGGGGPMADDERRAIRDCLDTLEPLPRTLCWLVFVEGHSGRGAARIVAMPEATVRTTVADALGRLRRCLERKGVLEP